MPVLTPDYPLNIAAKPLWPNFDLICKRVSYTHLLTHTHAHTRTHTHTHTHIHTYTLNMTYLHVHTYKCTFTCTTCAHTQCTHAQTHIHTYAHVCTCCVHTCIVAYPYIHTNMLFNMQHELSVMVLLL